MVKKLMSEEEQANEIIRRLKYQMPKYIILEDRPFTMEFWIKWPPDEKQKISKAEETCPGCRRDNASSSGAAEE